MIKRTNKMTLKAAMLVGAAAFALSTAQAQAPDDKKITFDIAPQELGAALTEFGVQSGREVYFVEADVAGKTTNGIEGQYTSGRAIAVILANANIPHTFDDNGTVLVGNEYVRGASASEEAPAPFRVALLDQENDLQGVAPRNEDDEEARQDVIVVTGTNIRGVSPDSSPSITFDREAIAKTGVSTTEQFIATLPQNFSGGISEVSFLGGTRDVNLSDSTGVNLRGLGSDATLTLLDGRRLAPAGIGNAVDVSMIPLSIIERVEFVTDGASAIYGSDAIGGVVNFTTRSDFDGALTTLSAGTITNGGHREFIGSQALGKRFDRGNILGVVDYRTRTALTGEDPDFAKTALQPVDIFPDRESHSVFVSGRFEPVDRLSLTGRLLYGGTQTERGVTLSSGTFQEIDIENEALTVSGGAAYQFAETWQLDLYGLFSRSENQRGTRNDGVDLSASDRTSTTISADAKLDGALFSLLGGEVRLAVGGQYRKEDYELRATRFDAPPSSTLIGPDRDIYAAFAEVFVPLVSDANRAPGIERLELTAAGRFEDYSDFGSSTNPKVGLLWSPLEGLNLRGTWGTSFRAPLLEELFNTGNAQIVPVPSAFLTPGPDGAPAPTTLFVLGSNSSLGPEEATTWTAGFDFTPSKIDGLRLSATYYDIDYSGQIVIPSVNFFDIYALEDVFSPLIDRSPDPAEIDALAADPAFVNFFAVPLSDIEAIVDNRLNNASSTKVNGVDFQVSYGFDLGEGRLSFDLNGSYLFSFENQLEGGSPPTDDLDTVFNPVDLNLRGGATWSSGPFSINSFINYVDSYEDNRPASAGPIDSFTTVDLSMAYDFDQRNDEGLLDGASLSFSVRNFFDEGPPFVEGNFNSLDYDGTNADPVGRFVSVQMTKEW